jgi:hypothetical protein
LKPYSNLNEGCHAPSLLPHQSVDTVLVSEHLLNSHQCFRAEVTVINGRSVVRLGRWKLSVTGPARTGQVFEFGAHRTDDIAKLISDVQRYLDHNGGAETVNGGGR